MDSIPRIKPLPTSVIAQIKSSIIVTSLNAVAIELLKNSLDANASKIEVLIDYSRGNCVVEDDGVGIPPIEFTESGGLGKLHYSSKYNGTTTTYGNRGAFLVSIAALSLVSITSHHHLHHSHNTLIINRSQVVSRQIPAPPYQHIHNHKHGTRVTVHDLFGNMPVRVKQRVEESSRSYATGRDWEELRKLATSLILAYHSPVIVMVRNVVSGQKLHFRETRSTSASANDQAENKFVAHVCNILSQAMFISSPDQSKWILTGASTTKLRIRGAISQEPAPTKAAQFLSMGMEPLNNHYGHSVIYDEINRLFESSSFGSEGGSRDFNGVKTESQDIDHQSKIGTFTTKDLRGSKKGLDRWPMFFIQIESLDSVSQGLEFANTSDIMEGRKGSLSSIMELLKVMVLEFLNSCKFQPRVTRPIHFSQNKAPGCTRNLTKGDSKAAQRINLTLQSSEQVQTRKFGSPFDKWSRVKIGSPKPTSQIPEESYKSKLQVSNKSREPAVSSAGLLVSDKFLPLNSYLDSANLRSIAPMITQSGKVTCLPFGGLPEVKSEAMSTSISTHKNVPLSISDKCSNGEERLHRVNPIVKRGSLINIHTSLINTSPKISKLTSRVSSHLTPDILGSLPIRDLVVSPEDTNPSVKSSTWIDEIMRNWNNPIYSPTEMSIPKVSTEGLWNESQQFMHNQLHKCLAFQETSTIIDGRISKEALRQAEVISQVDNKFILIKIPEFNVSPDVRNVSANTDMLIIVDQHAADERCRIEELLEELFDGPVIGEYAGGEMSTKSSIASTLLEKPITVVMPGREAQLLQMYAQHFAKWAIIYEVQHTRSEMNQHQDYKIIVRSLPTSIIERCTAMPKLLVELLRSELWSYSERKRTSDTAEVELESTGTNLNYPWLRKMHYCPQALLEMLNSRACRSAIMFNDVLSNDQCKALISRLAECAFPFQCAHGRPSMIPLVSLNSFTSNPIFDERPDRHHEVSFGSALKQWKSGMPGTQSSTRNMTPYQYWQSW